MWFFSFSQRNLYPTVGLQTPGEIVDANFGQLPFVFDIEEMRKVCSTFEFCITFSGASMSYDATSAKTAHFLIKNSLLIIDGLRFTKLSELTDLKYFMKKSMCFAVRDNLGW